MSRQKEGLSRRSFIRRSALVVGGGAVVLVAPDVVKRGAIEGAKGLIEGLNPFTREEQERILGIVPGELSTLNDVGIARRKYVITSEMKEGWDHVPGWVAGEKATLTTRWSADWKIKDFSELTQPGKVVLVPEQRLVVLTIPRPSPTDINIDLSFTPKMKRERGGANGTLGIGTMIEAYEFNKMNMEAMRKMVDTDGEAAEYADKVGISSFMGFCTGLLQTAGCMNAQFGVAYEGDATIADPSLQHIKGVKSVEPDGPPVPLQLYIPEDPQVPKTQGATTTTVFSRGGAQP